MVAVITRNKVKNRPEYAKLALAFAEDIKNDCPGCLSMVTCVPQDSEDELLFISTWETKEAWQAHVGGPVFMKHIPGMGPYYVSGTDSFFDVL